MTTVDVHTLDADGRATVERIAPPAPSRETLARLMDLRTEAERMGADWALPLVRAGLNVATEPEALAAAEALEGMLADELEARKP